MLHCTLHMDVAIWLTRGSSKGWARTDLDSLVVEKPQDVSSQTWIHDLALELKWKIDSPVGTRHASSCLAAYSMPREQGLILVRLNSQTETPCLYGNPMDLEINDMVYIISTS